jgi:hypothetical protein
MFDSNKINAPTAPMPRNPKLGSKCKGLWIAILALAMGITTGSVSADEEQTLIFSYQVDVNEWVTALYGPGQGQSKSEKELGYLPGDQLKVPNEMLEAMKNGAEIVEYVIVTKGSPYRVYRCRWIGGRLICR